MQLVDDLLIATRRPRPAHGVPLFENVVHLAGAPRHRRRTEATLARPEIPPCGDGTFVLHDFVQRPDDAHVQVEVPNSIAVRKQAGFEQADFVPPSAIAFGRMHDNTIEGFWLIGETVELARRATSEV